MSTAKPGSGSLVTGRTRHALGLPSGSVRALLAILIFATTLGLLVVRPSQEVPDYLRDLLFIIMGHYFATRHRAARAQDDDEPAPLFLPRGSVRLLLVAGCVAVAVVLFRRGQLTAVEKNPGVITLLLVGGFLLGVVLNAVFTWWKNRGHPASRFFEDLRALISIVAGALLVALVWNRLVAYVAPDQIDAFFARWVRLGHYGPEHVLAAIVGFYFGSRS
jgi:hypothetical protein